MLSGKVEHKAIEGPAYDIRQEPNSVILAFAWFLLLLVLGFCIIIFASDLTLRLIGVASIASSLVSFLVFRKILRQQGFAPAKKKEPWPAFDWSQLRQPTLVTWSSLDEVQKTGVVLGILVIIICLVFLIYVWLTYGY